MSQIQQLHSESTKTAHSLWLIFLDIHLEFGTLENKISRNNLTTTRRISDIFPPVFLFYIRMFFLFFFTFEILEMFFFEKSRKTSIASIGIASKLKKWFRRRQKCEIFRLWWARKQKGVLKTWFSILVQKNYIREKVKKKPLLPTISIEVLFDHRVFCDLDCRSNLWTSNDSRNHSQDWWQSIIAHRNKIAKHRRCFSQRTMILNLKRFSHPNYHRHPWAHFR